MMRILTALLLTAGIASAQGYDPITASRVRAWRIGAAPTGVAFPTNGLVAYWSMDSVSGTTVYDTWGSNDGTAVGTPTYSAGKNVDAVNLNGSSQYISYDGSAIHAVAATTYSVSAWCKFASFGGNNTVVDLTETPSSLSVKFRIIYLQSIDSFQFLVRGSDNVGREVAVARGSLTTSDWVHFVGTRSGNNIEFFINGTSVGTNSLTIGTHTPTSYYGSIGVVRNFFVPTGDAFCNGNIDEVAIWNRALSSNEVSGIYNNGAGRFYEP